jgi:hypothetical protein
MTARNDECFKAVLEELRACTHKSPIVRQSLAAANDMCGFALEAQAPFCRRRHQPRRPPLAKIKPGRPAPAIGQPPTPLAPSKKGRQS